MIKLTVGKGYQNEKILVSGNEEILIIGKDGGEMNLEVVLEKEGASVEIYGIIIGKKDQVFKISTISSHLAPNTKSRVHIKGIFQDSSKMDYSGLIKIDKFAQLSDAYLKNDNLLIGDDVKVDSSPQLEISADDVKASHGVTISTIDDLQEFYLMSRGMSKSDSRELLILGFINEIASKFEI